MAITIDGDNGISGVNGSATTPALQGTDSNTGIVFGTDEVQVATGGSTRAMVGSAGNVSIGTTTNTNKLRVHNGSDSANIILATGADESSEFISLGIDSGVPTLTGGGVSSTDAALAFRTADNGTESEVARFDKDGRLGIGVSDPKRQLHLDGGSGGVVIQLTNDTTGKTSDGDGFQLQLATDGTARVIQRENLNLAFDTNNTERARITNAGSVRIGKTSSALATAGHVFDANGTTNHTRSDGAVVSINRTTSDGTLIDFYQNTSVEGNITVSGSTVSYTGAHLARWSQLASGAERIEILRGSVLSNLDEMCEWAYEAQDAVLYTEEDELPEGVSVGDVKTPAVAAGTEDNEQLNRMKVSDVEGDVNVAGVFQAWDDDDDTYTNDFYCAMTGDFVIRIAQGTTVARGDLLMSAGDGTAKPQDDDIVRSKTIAKVTSTTVSTTYTDGSYCVPCVLMAC